MRYKHKNNIDVFLNLIIISLPLPYINGIYGTKLVYLNIVPLLLSAIVIISNKDIVFRVNERGLVLFIGLVITCTIPTLIYADANSVLLLLRYAILGIYFLFIVSPIVFCNTKGFAKKLTTLAVFFAIVGIFSLLMNSSVDVGLLTIRKYYDYKLFGFWLPTTSSLFWNTNYYGICQTLSLPFSLFYYDMEEGHKVLKLLILFTILSSVLFSGSRSAILLSAFVVISFIFAKLNKKQRALVLLLGAVIVYANSNIILHSISDLVNGGKGLNCIC